MKITVDLKAIPNQECDVLNYFKKPARWENGVVCDVDVMVDANGRPRPKYRVRLHRKSSSGNMIFVTVGCNEIVGFGTSSKN